MEKDAKRPVYTKPMIIPLKEGVEGPEFKSLLPPASKKTPSKVSGEIGTLSPMEANELIKNSRTTPLYRSGYVTGFSQALHFIEYLMSRGLNNDIILKQLNNFLGEDILPWQKGEQKK